jgi:hypothetical protein
MESYTVEKVEDLVAAFRSGVDTLFLEAKSDPALAARLRERELKVLGSISNAEGVAMLEWVKQKREK